MRPLCSHFTNQPNCRDVGESKHRTTDWFCSLTIPIKSKQCNSILMLTNTKSNITSTNDVMSSYPCLFVGWFLWVEFGAAWLNVRGLLGLGGGRCSHRATLVSFLILPLMQSKDKYWQRDGKVQISTTAAAPCRAAPNTIVQKQSMWQKCIFALQIKSVISNTLLLWSWLDDSEMILWKCPLNENKKVTVISERRYMVRK